MKPAGCVAALTYKRPEGVAELLEGFRALRRPEGWEVRFLLVDNDPAASARAQAEAAAFRGSFHYVEPPEPNSR